MSYLRGPITREQIRVLMEPRKAAARTTAPATMPTPAIAATTAFASTVTAPTVVAPVAAAPAAGAAPTLSPDVSRFFIPVRGSRKSRTVVYKPYLLGAARTHFIDTKLGVDQLEDIVAVTPIVDAALPVDWEQGEVIDLAVTDLEKNGDLDAQYGALPAAAGQSKSYTTWSKNFAMWAYRTQKLEMFRSSSLKLTSEPGETERDFRLRLQQLARERRDDSVDALRKKYASKMTTLQERIRKAEQAVEREQAQARQAGLQTAVNVGSTLLGALLGRKAVSSSTVGKAATTAKSLGRASQQREDIARAEETVEALQKQLADLQAEFDVEAAALAASIDPMTEELIPVIVKPKKTDITVQLVSLVWMPHWQDEGGGLLAAS